MSLLDAQNVKPTDKLFKDQHDATGNFFFSKRENHGEPHFLTVRVAFHFTIDGW